MIYQAGRNFITGEYYNTSKPCIREKNNANYSKNKGNIQANHNKSEIATLGKLVLAALLDNTTYSLP